jgi:hypothetical protein
VGICARRLGCSSRGPVTRTSLAHSSNGLASRISNRRISHGQARISRSSRHVLGTRISHRPGLVRTRHSLSLRRGRGSRIRPSRSQGPALNLKPSLSCSSGQRSSRSRVLQHSHSRVLQPSLSCSSGLLSSLSPSHGPQPSRSRGPHLSPREKNPRRSNRSESPFLTRKAHGKPWAFLRQAVAGSMPAISTSRPPKSGWVFSRMR